MGREMLITHTVVQQLIAKHKIFIRGAALCGEFVDGA
jgi:hypothetical protein